MLASVASQHDVSPSGIVGLIVAASSAVGGLYFSFTSKLRSLFRREIRLDEIALETGVPEFAARKISSDIGLYSETISRHSVDLSSEYAARRRSRREYSDPLEMLRLETEFREIRGILFRSRAATWLALFLALGTAGLFFYASFLLIFGTISAGIVTGLASAVPAAISYGAIRASNRADKRADLAADKLAKRIEQDNAIKQLRVSLDSVGDASAREALNVLSSLKGMFPDATPEQLAAFVGELTTKDRNKPAPKELPDQDRKELE
jgi:hypothetical protein